MNEINRTLYIPLYGKALVSRKGLFLKDETAQRLWEEVAFPLRSKAKSKWLAYFLGIRAAVFDGWLREQLQAHPDATVLHLGCGLDSRIHRVGNGDHRWYDVDFPAVIDERRRRFSETETYRMLGTDLNESDWLSSLEGDTAIVVMEGVAMYLNPDAWRTLLTRLSERFEAVTLLVDVYTEFGAKMSKAHNPVKDVGVQTVYGVSEPADVGKLRFVCEHDMTPKRFVDELRGFERRLFSTLYGGRFAKTLYRMYEYSA